MLSSLFSHGVGPPGELPMSVTTLGLVAAAALIISFAALVSGWREARFPNASNGKVLLHLNSLAGRLERNFSFCFLESNFSFSMTKFYVLSTNLHF